MRVEISALRAEAPSAGPLSAVLRLDVVARVAVGVVVVNVGLDRVPGTGLGHAQTPFYHPAGGSGLARFFGEVRPIDSGENPQSINAAISSQVQT